MTSSTASDARRSGSDPRWALPILLLVAIVVGTGASAQPVKARVQTPVLDGCVRAGSQARVVTMTVGRGDDIRTAVLGSGAVGAVLANQSDRDLCSWLPFARMLRQVGYRVLLFEKKLVLLPGAAHGVDLLRGPTAADVRGYVLAFLRSHR